uniref:Uncharacterized protein n=1 Tax=Rhizophora mucronata TaxID=61149 RepID=A0A2P2N2W2_RHIMU
MEESSVSLYCTLRKIHLKPEGFAICYFS